MASGPGVNHGKTDFVKDYLDQHQDAKHEAVNDAWVAAGHEGTVSDSLVNKVRQKLGLTGRRRTRTASRAQRDPARDPKTRDLSQSKGDHPGPTPRPSSEAKVSKRTTLATRSGDDDDILDELEEGIDELVQRIREMGGRPDVVKALRRARRLLVRGHES